MSKIARVFLRKTKLSPTDDLAFFEEPGLIVPEVDEVHVSVLFSWDAKRAEVIAKEWERVAPVSIGGPGVGTRGEEFIPGVYMEKGCVITSRGCPNNCWFCSVHKRDGDIRELSIKDGWIINDDNLLACSEKHIRDVFTMLKRQKQKPNFVGGLEAARLKDWHVDLLVKSKPQQIFFAYDTPDDYEPLVQAAKMMKDAGFTRNTLRVYMLIGHPKDTFEAAEKRLYSTLELDMFPMAMLYRNKNGDRPFEWRKFQREWCRPAAIYHKYKKVKGNDKPRVVRQTLLGNKEI